MDQRTPPESNLLAVHTDRIKTERIREAGPVHVGYQFWLRLGMEEALSAVGLSERERKLSCAMTLNRLVHPCSKLAMPASMRTTALPDILEADFENLAGDALYRHAVTCYHGPAKFLVDMPLPPALAAISAEDMMPSIVVIERSRIRRRRLGWIM